MSESPPKSRYQHTQVTLRLPAHILRRVDEVAAEQMTNRASVLRQCLALGAGCKPTPSTVTSESAEPNI
jgi:hypothetical protein